MLRAGNYEFGICGWAGALCVGVLLALGPALAPPGRAAAASCRPWPGEPAPLPSVADPDPVRARWALLRSRELEQRARELEGGSPAAAQRLWARLECLGVRSEAAEEGLRRSRRLRVHRLRAGADATAGSGDPWQRLADPVSLPASPPPLSPERLAQRQGLLAEIDVLLEATQAHTRAARFEEGLRSAAEARERLDAMRWEDDLLRRWVRLDIAQATIEVALGREQEARESARRALSRNPALRLDPESTSPKVIRVFESARRSP